MEESIVFQYIKETYIALTTIGLAWLGYRQVASTNKKEVEVATLSADKELIQELTVKLTTTDEKLIEALESSARKDEEILNLKAAVKSLQAGFKISNALFESKFKGDEDAMVFVSQMTAIIEAMNSDV